jgi:hypothetical protein
MKAFPLNRRWLECAFRTIQVENSFRFMPSRGRDVGRARRRGLLSSRPPPKLLADADYRPALYRRWCGCCLKDGGGLERGSLGEKRSDRGKPEEAGAPASLRLLDWGRGRRHGTLKLQAAITFTAEPPLWILWALALGSPSVLRNKPSPLHISNRGKNILTPIFLSLSYSDNGPCKYSSRA